jgi:GDP-L-fucose synthase
MQNTFWSNKKILVTGGGGFLGSHLVKALKTLKPGSIRVVSSDKYDLREFRDALKASRGMDIVIHLAARVGGIGFNSKYPADLFDDNILMGTNMMRASRINKVKKYVAMGTICAYPKFTPVPFKEKDLWTGYPEETNAPYGLAKKMQLVQAGAYRQQYGFNAIFILPVNLYGPGDNFDPGSSHVIPALIKKFSDAKRQNKAEVVVWGSGKASREFLYVDDAVRGIIKATERYNKSDPVNLGAGFEITIKQLVSLIKREVGYKGKVMWDKSKPDGQPRRRLDVSRAKKEFGFKAQMDFVIGLKNTILWYENNLK